MTDISFYVLPTDSDASRVGLVVKLIEKAYEVNEPTFIYFNDENFMKQVDQAIWAISETSFIPHTIIESLADINEHDFIYLSKIEWELENSSLLINLSHDIPKNIEKYKRVFEIITTNPVSIEQSRERYRIYREKGFTLQTHKL